MAKLIWTRRYAFQSVHSLTSGARKERLHGHEYLLEVSFTGRDVNSVDEAVRSRILHFAHGRRLDFLTNSTGESLVNWAHDQLTTSEIGPRLCAVHLQETRKNRFTSSATDSKYV